MRDAVWLRELEKGHGEAFCEDCHKGPLKRTTNILERWAGHVAHDKGRRVEPADRFNPDKAKLKCRDCHLGNGHGMRFL